MESERAIQKKCSSNQFRHAIHTHSQGKIKTKAIAEALQHSVSVARKHYIHPNIHSTAFSDFFDMVTEERDTNNENHTLNQHLEEYMEEHQIDQNVTLNEHQEQNIEDHEDDQNVTLNEHQEEHQADMQQSGQQLYDFDGINQGDYVAVVYEDWYLGKIHTADPLHVDFMETMGNNKLDIVYY